MFGTLSRSWSLATTSYKVLWNHKRLVVFPMLSTIAGAVVLASFAAPLWLTGQIDRWIEDAQGPQGVGADVGLYVTLFLFYFCNYFVIVFFNSALIACVMQVLEGEEPSIERGLAVASRRVGQIFGWALVSAFVGVILRLIESTNKRAGELIAGLIGTAWTAMTYFVVPVIVLEGVGPVEAIRRSLGTLKSTWGTALVGNFSLALVGFLILLSVYLIAAGLVVAGFASEVLWVIVATIAVAVVLVVLAAAVSSSAATVLVALLYSYATGHTVPADVDGSQFAEAFVSKS